MNELEKHRNGDCDGGEGPWGCPYCKAEDQRHAEIEAEIEAEELARFYATNPEDM